MPARVREQEAQQVKLAHRQRYRLAVAGRATRGGVDGDRTRAQDGPDRIAGPGAAQHAVHA